VLNLPYSVHCELYMHRKYCFVGILISENISWE
jgi:hypothetical protein